MTPFTEKLWQETLPLYEQILHHPFNEDLKNGTLEEQIFKFYIYQDSLYLADFAKALAITGARLPIAYFSNFLTFAQNALIVEQVLHESYFQQFAIDFTSGKVPGCFAYTNYLLATALSEPAEVAVAALLPCFQIYKKVGDFIYANQTTPNPYQNWINAYSSKEFGKAVEKVLAICNELAKHASAPMLERMQIAYTTATRLEYIFWDSAYKTEQWPI
jgi:thiaminase/transcriptional activator TenA